MVATSGKLRSVIQWNSWVCACERERERERESICVCEYFFHSNFTPQPDSPKSDGSVGASLGRAER